MRNTLFSRMRLPMACVTTMNSNAAIMPRMSMRGSSAWHSTAISEVESCTRICSCWWRGRLVHDTRDGALGAGGVQRAEDQVARFGGTQGGLDGFQVAKLAHEHHVGVHTQHAAEGLGKAGHVHAHLALIDDRLLVLVVVLDRILDGDDVLVEIQVDVIDHRRQRGGLARAGRAGHQEHAARPPAQAPHDGGQADLFKGEDPAGNQSQDHGDETLLLEDRHAEPAGIAVGKTEVRAAFLLQFLLAALRRDGLHQADRVIGLQDLGFQRPQPSVQTQ